MVGGIVIETIHLENSVWINCQGTGSEKNEQCAIYVENSYDARAVITGDFIWWQGVSAYWTTADKDIKERALKKISGSGVNRPAV